MPNRPLLFQRWRRKGPPVLQSQAKLATQPGKAFQDDAFQANAFQIGPLLVMGAANAVGVAVGSATGSVVVASSGGGVYGYVLANVWPWTTGEFVEGEAHAVCVAKASATAEIAPRPEIAPGPQKVYDLAAQIADEDELLLLGAFDRVLSDARR